MNERESGKRLGEGSAIVQHLHVRVRKLIFILRAAGATETVEQGRTVIQFTFFKAPSGSTWRID